MSISISRTARHAVLAVLAVALVAVTGPVTPVAAAEASPFGPVVTLPLRPYLAPEAGQGTAAANAVLARDCGVPVAQPQWYRLPPGDLGHVFLYAQPVGGRPDPTSPKVRAGAYDLRAGSMLWCDSEPRRVYGDMEIAVVVYLDASSAPGCHGDGDCPPVEKDFLINSSQGEPPNADWRTPTPITSLPYTQTVDTSLAGGSQEVDLASPCPYGGPAKHAWNGVWWTYTPTVSGDLDAHVTAVHGLVPVDFSAAEVTDGYPLGQDWSQGCVYTRPRVEAGKTYLVTAFTPWEDGEDRGLARGDLLTFSLRAVVPSPPWSVDAVAGTASATVSWTPAPNAAGSQLTGYRVRALAADGTVATTTTAPATSTSVVVGGLANGVPYTFDVTGLRGSVVGTTSTPTDAVTPLAAVGPPTALAVTQAGTALTVTWSPPSSGAAAVTGYRVRRNWDGAVQTLPASTRSLTASGLTVWRSYGFTVSALTATGPGPGVQITSVLTAATPEPPGQPAVSQDRAALVVRWNAPARPDGVPVTSYRVRRYAADTGALLATTVVAATASPWRVSGLRVGSSYAFDVTAVNAAGAGVPSPRSWPVTLVSPPTGPVADLVSQPSEEPGKVLVGWAAPAVTAARPVTSYEVSAPSRYGPRVTWTQQATSVLLESLWGYQDSVVTVRPVNAAGKGPVTQLAVRPALAEEPGSPPAPRVSAVAEGTLAVSWTAPPAGSLPIRRYEVQVFAEGSSVPDPALTRTTPDASTTATLTGLTAGARYRVAVRALSFEWGLPGPRSGWVTVPRRPGPPTVTSAAATGPGAVTTTWQAPADSGGAPIRSYTVTLHRTEGVGGRVLETVGRAGLAASTRRASLTGLSPGVWVVTVTAVNLAGAGTPSSASAPVVLLPPA